jgi:hypothetical protein
LKGADAITEIEFVVTKVKFVVTKSVETGGKWRADGRMVGCGSWQGRAVVRLLMTRRLFLPPTAVKIF